MADVVHEDAIADAGEAIVQSRCVAEDVGELLLIVQQAAPTTLEVTHVGLVHTNERVEETHIRHGELVSHEKLERGAFSRGILKRPGSAAVQIRFELLHALFEDSHSFIVGSLRTRETAPIHTVVDHVDPIHLGYWRRGETFVCDSHVVCGIML